MLILQRRERPAGTVFMQCIKPAMGTMFQFYRSRPNFALQQDLAMCQYQISRQCWQAEIVPKRQTFRLADCGASG